MTTAEEQALIKKLGAKSNKDFDTRYSVPNRQWFVGKLIDFFESQANPDKEIPGMISTIIKAATDAVNARIKKGFSVGALTEFWKAYDQATSRTEIVYGAVAMNPLLLDAKNSSYLDFIVERRFRSLQRMAFFVNPNDGNPSLPNRKVFNYPSTALCGTRGMSVNAQSKSFWPGDPGGPPPFLLSSAVKTDPQKAIEALFTVNETYCDRNLFGCDPVATTLHMDALRVANDPDKLLKALAAVGDHYLKIDHPFGHYTSHDDGQRLLGVTSGTASGTGQNVEIPLGNIGLFIPLVLNFEPDDLKDDVFLQVDASPWSMIVQSGDHQGFKVTGVNPVQKKIRVDQLSRNVTAGAKVYVAKKNLPIYSTLPYHFLTDDRPANALFEQLSVTTADLQVGDHLYVINHPLYLLYNPHGAWGGEHSFIFNIGSRELKDMKYKLFRTDMKVAGHGLEGTLLSLMDNMLDQINVTLSRLQAITKIHLANLKANGRKTTSDVTFVPPTATGGKPDVNFFVYKTRYKYQEFDNGKGKDVTVTKGFILKEAIANLQSFSIFNSEGTDLNATPTAAESGDAFSSTFIGTKFSDEQFLLSKWGVIFYNTQTVTVTSQPFFEKDNKTGKLLKFDDLANSRPFLTMDDNDDGYITRPRVNFDAAYLKFLKDNGAIA
jgi:hypothetical protein